MSFDAPPRRSAPSASRSDMRASLDFARPAPRFSPPPGGFVLTLSLVFVIAFLVLVMVYLAGKEGEASPEPADAAPANAAAVPAAPTGLEGMVRIAPGTARVGWSEDLALKPDAVSFPAFFIDRHEVTNAAYAAYVEETGASPPPHWPGGEIPSGLDEHPVVNVSWEEAVAFARWRGCRLPTELEWERAARGRGGQTYPWGNAWDGAWTNVFRADAADPGPFAAMSISGDQRDGVFDLAGNVREWTASVYELQNVPLESARRVVRGSSFRLGAEQARGYCRQAELLDAREDDLGFRCARDAS